jgi:hypothetical protein
VWARQKKPHGSSYPPGLWWYRSLSPEQSARVIKGYLQQRGRRGATKVPSNFHERIEFWLSELTTNQGTKRNVMYWTLKGYALAHKINLHPFMAWFRTLEDVAKKLYPDRVPIGRCDKPLTEEAIQAIREDYLQADYFDRKAVKKIAAKHGIGTFRVGQLCRKEKQHRREEFDHTRAKTEAEQTAATPESHTDSFLSEEEGPFK